MKESARGSTATPHVVDNAAAMGRRDDPARDAASRTEALGAASTDVVTRSRAPKGARRQRGESPAGSYRGERPGARESDGFRVLVNGSWLQKSMEAPFASESARQPVR